MKPLLLAGIVMLARVATSLAQTAPPPDVHYVYDGVTNAITSKGNGTEDADYTDLAISAAVAGRKPGRFNEGGLATATVNLASGSLRLTAVAFPSTHAVGNGGQASSQAGLGARIFLSGPAKMAGKIQVTTHVVGTFDDPDTYGDGGQGAYGSDVSIYVAAGETAGEPGFVRPYDGLVYSASDGTTTQLTCTHCRMPTGAPLPVDAITVIPFKAGQTYVDFGANLTVEALGAATVSVRAVSFSIKLPPGFTYRSTLKFSGQ